MSRKNVLKYELAVAQSLSANFNSSPTIIKFLDNISYQINVNTTNSIGTFYVQGSNDYNVDETTGTVTNPGHWVDLILGGGVPFANAANDSILIDMNQVPFYAIRVRYQSSTAGTGTCDIFLIAKQLGA